ncbi:universal stress protein [Acuticoccus sediminis]|uniref:universal stress protein n=1 Tax=Acuticoccus sediminis TaxID=2184697 RepID=UPI001CFD9CE2|nr:universal stress protein [Acuticoccus sediminis]
MAVGKVVALVDGSSYSTSVCEHAAWIASRHQVPVELVHVIGRRETAPHDLLEDSERGDLLDRLREMEGQRHALADQMGEAILAEAAALTTAAGAPEVHRKVRHGDLIEALHELEVDARYIVVGKRGAAADFAKLHLGSNIERVVRASRVNVMVASRAFSKVKRFLVAYDGGRSARKAIELISRSPLYTGLKPHILTVSPNTAEAQRQLEAAEEALNWSGDVVTDAAPGDAEKVIAGYVEENCIDLLVMGAYGHSRVRNLLVGSTTSQMMRSCRIPVLIVR